MAKTGVQARLGRFWADVVVVTPNGSDAVARCRPAQVGGNPLSPRPEIGLQGGSWDLGPHRARRGEHLLQQRRERWEVVIADRIDETGLNLLRSDGRLCVTYRPDVAGRELPGLLASARALIVRGRTKVTKETLAAAPNLVVIGRAGSGLDNIDAAAAAEAGVEVVNAAAGSAAATAELTLLHMLSLARDYYRAVGAVKGGGWGRDGFLGDELDGKVLGILGLGAVGRELAKKAAGIGMTVLGYDPYAGCPPGCQARSFEDLLGESDYVSVHVPLTHATRHMIDAEALSKTKPGARLINCSRGGVVDEEALLEALERGHLAGAALDVYEVEPPQGAVLTARSDVVGTPHIGAATRQARRKIALEVAQRVRQVLTQRLAPSP